MILKQSCAGTAPAFPRWLPQPEKRSIPACCRFYPAAVGGDPWRWLRAYRYCRRPAQQYPGQQYAGGGDRVCCRPGFRCADRCRRELIKADGFVRNERWPQQSYPLTTSIFGKKLGIVGLGRIGAAIARRATGFSMEIRYHNRSARTELPWRYEPSLVDLAEWADFLVVATPGGAETDKLISASILTAPRPQQLSGQCGPRLGSG